MKMKQKPNVSITGASSSIARPLAAELLADDKYGKVLFIDTEFPPALDPDIALKTVDLIDPESDEKIYEVLEEERVDILVHCAFTEVPSRTPQLAHELETVGTMNVLSACSRKKIKKIILLSHTDLYGAHPDNPQLLMEHHPLRAERSFQFYADKIEAERLVGELAQRSPGVTVSILRVCPIIGSNADNLTTKILGSLWVPVIAGYNPLVQFIHQHDAVRAFKIFCDGDYPGVFNITGRGYMPLLTAIHLLGNIPVPLPEPVFDILAGSLYSFYLSSMPQQIGPYLKYSFLAGGEKAGRIAGYEPTYSIKEVIEEFYRFWARRSLEK
jgi:UDP-glucose 4-epimerase